MQTEISEPEGERIMPGTRFTEFPALSVDPRVGISQMVDSVCLHRSPPPPLSSSVKVQYQYIYIALAETGASYNLDDSRARAYCACSRCGWGLFGHFYSALSFLLSSPCLWGTVRYRLKYCLKGLLSQKQTNKTNTCRVFIESKPAVVAIYVVRKSYF